MGETHSPASRSQPDWDNLSVLHRNTLPPRSSFFLFDSEDDALSRDVTKAKAVSLAGTWKFNLANSPFEAPPGFENIAPDSLDKDGVAVGSEKVSWSNIQVPGMWQLQGFGKGPHYTNVQFPFFVDPPHPPYFNNECGSYLTSFRVPKELENDQLRLRFEGVDSGFHIWVNGHEVGYSQGARNPSEFDITKFAQLGKENTLAVRVYQFTDGSYIEDQDQWWLSGIYRDVFLLGFPKEARFEDLSIRTNLDESYSDAVLEIEASVSGVGALDFKLMDSKGDLVATASYNKAASNTDTVNVSIPVTKPHKWTAETPYLYTLVASLDGRQYMAHRVGFRKVELKDGLIKVNGKKVVFKGANRHEHHPEFGRAVPYEFMKQDLLLMKTHNLNAIRTSHQPSDIRLYDLADEIGLWVMDEADLECHGFETIADLALPVEQQALPFFERQQLTRASAAKWTSDNPEWRDAYLDRAKQLVHRDKLHPSVIIWSLGNEAFYGSNHTAMTKWIHDFDPTRLVHYEPDLEAEYVDMHSRMYPQIADIVKFGQDASKTKPLVLCEFIHAMGTGPGNIKEYVDAFYQYPKLQGGWVWEWANHGLLTKTKDGQPFYAYGGDFADTPNDYNFVMDGVVNSDHSPRSALIEYKKALEPVQIVSVSEKSIKIINRLDFVTLDHLDCTWTVSHESGSGSESGKIAIPEGVAPGATVELMLPNVSQLSKISGEAFLDLSFALKEPEVWAKKGHEVALLQIPLAHIQSATRPELEKSSQVLKVEATPTDLAITGGSSTWRVDLIQGHLASWKKNENSVVSRPLTPTFYRAPTDNDAPRDGKEWKDCFLHLAGIHTRNAQWEQQKNGDVVVSFDQKFAPPALSWSIDLTTRYTFSAAGSLQINIAGSPKGVNLPQTLPRIGVTLGLASDFQRVTWFGRGPGESYKDMKLSQRVALHSVPKVDQLWANPEFPQESSNRTDTRWVKLASADASLTAQFVENNDTRRLFDFMASHYEVKDIDETQHPHEIQKQSDVILRLDADHHGLGTGSCGPKTLDEYALKTEPFEFSILLQ